VPLRLRWTRRLACLLFLAAAAGVQAQDAKNDDVLVRIETALGSVDIAVDARHAPITAANFLKYVDAKLYDGGRFHRVTRPDNYTPAPPDRPAMAIVQGGINPARRSEGFPAIALERTSVTGLTHVVGTVSMARGAQADTARSDFFICLDDQPSLDFGGKRFDDAQGAGAFGRVVKGLDVVRRIQQEPTNKDAETAMGKQTLTTPVTITRMSRIQ
jgi:peptidyl-prolyl cis-trans isomerase A (cyclophilin A)